MENVRAFFRIIFVLVVIAPCKLIYEAWKLSIVKKHCLKIKNGAYEGEKTNEEC
jgi:hypothetical protein